VFCGTANAITKTKEDRRKIRTNIQEAIMKSSTIINDNTKIDLNDEVMGFSLKVGVVLAALVGVWGLACLTAGLANVGAIGMLKGYVTAITGF
jgi:hypothetical protein